MIIKEFLDSIKVKEPNSDTEDVIPSKKSLEKGKG